jgi:sugar phosphate isomerase/epimerase
VGVSTGKPEPGTIVGRRATRALGIDQPAGWWPTTPRLKSYEAAGFTHVQVRTPPGPMLVDRTFRIAHAGALAERLSLTGLALILHAPDELLAGLPEQDRQLAGTVDYAALAGAELLVYHGARLPIQHPRVRTRLADEERSLRRLVPTLERSGVRLAIENLAPVYPGPELVCHDPAAVAALVRRLESESVGMCLDVGHAHIAADLADCQLRELVAPVVGDVILFHVHDNFGAKHSGPLSGGVEPGKLDLHLCPGAGTVDWEALRGLVGPHTATLQLEVHAAQRPEPRTLAALASELLGTSTPAPVR